MQQLLGANILLVLFNMIPAFPMDGGRVLRALLAVGLGQQRATRIAAFIGQTIAGLFVIGGLFQANFLLAFIGVFVFLGASQEVAFQTRREAIAGHVAHEAMITKFETLAPQDTLGRAAELLLATHQHDFPVIDAWNRIAGVLPRARLLEGPAVGARHQRAEVMLRETVQVAPATDLEAVPSTQRDPSTRSSSSRTAPARHGHAGEPRRVHRRRPPDRAMSAYAGNAAARSPAPASARSGSSATS